jgi:hypothetical protein
VKRRGGRDTERKRSRESGRAAIPWHSGLELVGQSWNRQRRRGADRRELTALGSGAGDCDAHGLRPAVLRHLAFLLCRSCGQTQAGHSPENGLELDKQQESGKGGLHERNTIAYRCLEQAIGGF